MCAGRDEPLPAGSPYIFVSSSAMAEEATAVMAVLGPHALALAREADDPETNQNFKVVRMRRCADAIQDAAQEAVWEIVTSTGSPPQERALRELVELTDQGFQCPRGSNIYLGSRTWFVWDTGRKGAVRDC
ncbi:hypothetical protein JVU11DRAFT_8856 [Chiua virens]|nr:hypothetical protein JVU11DRAFT_8856 [Chiua virens]